jgi:hypothetical protein
MTKQEEITQLRKYPKHYLWDKERKDWTKDDLAALRNPNESQVQKKGLIKKNKLPVIGKKDGIEKEFATIKEAAVEMGVSTAAIYQQLAYSPEKHKAKITFRRPEIVVERYQVYASDINYHNQ